MLYFILFEGAVINCNKVLNKSWMYTSRWLQSFSSRICGRYPRNWMNSMLVVLTFHYAGENKHTPLESKRKSLDVMWKGPFFGTTVLLNCRYYYKHSKGLWLCLHLFEENKKQGKGIKRLWTTVWWSIYLWLHVLPHHPLTFVLEFHCLLLIAGPRYLGQCLTSRPHFKTVWNL